MGRRKGIRIETADLPITPNMDPADKAENLHFLPDDGDKKMGDLPEGINWVILTPEFHKLADEKRENARIALAEEYGCRPDSSWKEIMAKKKL